MRFEWDVHKALINAMKHGISFKRAVFAFDDPNHFIMEDEWHSTRWEQRYKLIGQMFPTAVPRKSQVVVIVFIISPNRSRRLISARPATSEERTFYEKNRQF